MDRQEEKIEIVINTRKTKDVSFSIYADHGDVDWGDGTSGTCEVYRYDPEEKNLYKRYKVSPCSHSYHGINWEVTIVITAFKLIEFEIEHVPVTRVRFEHCDRLGLFLCPDCGIKRLDLRGAPNLFSLNCACNDLRRLDLSGCDDLVIVKCDCNNLSVLNLFNCEKLKRVSCSFNRLKKLRVAYFPEKLSSVECSYNNLSAKELYRLFIDITLFENMGTIDYSLNPGTAEVDSSVLYHRCWTIMNTYTEKKVERVSRERGY